MSAPSKSPKSSRSRATPPTATLLVCCDDQPGLVAALSQLLYALGLNILDVDQHTDPVAGKFFQRIRFDLTVRNGEAEIDRQTLEGAVREVAERFSMQWTLRAHDERPRMAIFVSKTDHCLYDLLLRHRSGELRCEIPLLVSNHPDLEPIARQFEIPYHVFPITPETKADQEAREIALLREHAIDLVVMARYMQILSEQMIDAFPMRIINIHHSFLPAFQGGKPYHQAHRRGVKLVGATAHYATLDLDEGPIIEQGRRSRVPPRGHPRTRAQGPGRRAHGALACGRLAPRRPRPRVRQQDRRLRLTAGGPMDGKLLFLGLLIAILALAWVGAGVMWRAAEVGEIVAPIETEVFDGLSVVTVGTGNAYENPERHGPATVVGLGTTALLVDAGRGVAEGLRSAKIPLQQPGVVLLTNLLPANVMGLDDLVFTGWLAPREQPLRVLGPPGTKQLVESLGHAYAAGRAALGPALELPAAGGQIEVQEISDLFSETIGEIVVEARALPDGPLPTLAWRFSHDGRRVVVSGSGWGEATLASFAGNADLLVHEAAYLPTVAELEGTGAEVPHPERVEAEAALHTSILEVGDLAADAQVRKLVLVRLRPPPFFKLQVRSIVGNDFTGEIVVPDDGEWVFP